MSIPNVPHGPMQEDAEEHEEEELSWAAAAMGLEHCFAS